MGGRPQEKINKDLNNCELVVIILWMRCGVTTGIYSSGIEEEFTVAKKRYNETKKPEIHLFFRDIPDDRRLNPDDHISRVLKFKAEIESAKELLFSRYENPEGWKKQFRIQLNNWFDRQPFGISEKLKHVDGMALVYKNLGWLYEQINDYDNAEKVYEACANCYKK